MEVTLVAQRLPTLLQSRSSLWSPEHFSETPFPLTRSLWLLSGLQDGIWQQTEITPTPTLFWTSVTLQPCTWMEEKKNSPCKANRVRKKGSLGDKEKGENKMRA